MSNATQFFPQGARLGESITLPYNGDSFTAADGTVWKAANGNALSYSSAYAQLLTDAPQLVTAATKLNGPFNGGLWGSWSTGGIVGATTGGATWVTISSNPNSLDTYFTTTDAGSTWTQRTVPVASKFWMPLWDGTNFVLYARSTTTDGVQESTDGITWTARTGISISALSDFLYNGSVYLVVPGSGSTAATSSDRTTWTSRTLASAVSYNTGGAPGLGCCTWNAGAGLFILGSSVAGTYQTSPDGATWTNRTVLRTDISFIAFSNITKFASDATTTVALGANGVVATSTNGTSWTFRGQLASSFLPGTSTVSSLLYHDGTRFVALYGGVAFYSTDGVSWTRNSRGTLPQTGGYMMVPGGVGTAPAQGQPHVFTLSDFTSTTATNIVVTAPSVDSASRTYVRIK